MRSCLSSIRSRDHPRMYGEHIELVKRENGVVGSSPHVRGALNSVTVALFNAGIIPACTGSTYRKTLLATVFWDHPRMYGEHVPHIQLSLQYRGSSPHVRGAQVQSACSSRCLGIIPACTGSTVCGRFGRAARWDHPLMYGEHFSKKRKDAAWWGSSPHVRGALDVDIEVAASHGIIPACTGSTNSANRTYKYYLGSSPHVRGAPAGHRRQRLRAGIIPACTGSTH